MLTSASYYLCLRRNRFELTNLASGETHIVHADTPFTTTRLIVGNFEAAESLLQKTLKDLKASFPVLIIHALEMNEDGLSFVEQRALREMGLGAGARAAFIYEGSPLQKDDALAFIKSARQQQAKEAGSGQALPTWLSAALITGFIAVLAFMAFRA